MQRFDIAIIGSGTAGGTLAYYLTKAGKKCVLIEAGTAYNSKSFPRNEMDYTAQLFWNGGMDVSTDAGLVFLRGKCLGGGSIVNQCLLDRFDHIAFDEWKQISGVDFFSSESMNHHYEEIESRLSLKKIAKEHWNRNAQLYVQGFDKIGLKWSPLRRGQVDCATEQGNDCILCLGGCPRDSKQSVLVVFLPDAIKNGLEIITEYMITKLVYQEQGIIISGEKDGKSEDIVANKVILAGGSLGSTQLLLRSGFKKYLPALGEGFFCHPQIMNFAVYDEIVDSHKGAFQAVKSDDPAMRARGFKLENVFAQPIAIAMLYPGFGKKHQQWMNKYRYFACIEVAIRDVGRGSLSVTKTGKLKIKKKLSKEDRKRARAGVQTVHKIFASLGAKKIFHSPFVFGLHLMGGCAMGVDPKTSVVNARFQVHGFPNLYIADSSIFPSAPGINPALTIMALAHRASENILQLSAQ